MFKLFGSKKPVSQVRRADGYRECDVALIIKFQKQYEAQYPDAVRCALYAARDSQFVVTEVNLMKFVNNEMWDKFGVYN